MGSDPPSCLLPNPELLQDGFSDGFSEFPGTEAMSRSLSVKSQKLNSPLILMKNISIFPFLRHQLSSSMHEAFFQTSGFVP